MLNVQFSDSSTLSWDATVTAQDYNVYRGLLRDLQVGNPPRCHVDEVVGTSVVSSAAPEVGEVYVYLLSAENATDEEGTLGTDSDAVERESLGKCDAVMFHHVLQRLGYGWSEWGRDRLQTLGFTAYRDEQLDPLTIDESGDSRAQLWTRWDPPVNEGYLQYRLLDESIYSLRQLQHHTTEFWFNHFNTEFRKVYDNTPGAAADRNLRTAQMQQREMDAFRDLAFYGSFREILEASALSAAMILYLDTNINTKDRPNENHARELMELHSMGVDNGYTEADVQELSRVLTGWNVCNKALADIDNPTAPCIANDAAGQRATNFRSNEHDTGQKILFAGTAYETIIPDTSGNPADGINDIQLALDTIADHPATKEFIATKLLRRFIVEDPTPQMVQGVVDAWTLHNGDNREILRAVLSEANVLNPDFVGQKLKTPWEQGVTGYRATRGLLQSFIAPFLRNWINRMGQLPFRNPIPTGYSESGGDWLGTNAQLDRQDYGMDIVLNASYAQEINLMVSEYSLTTDEEIVDFFADVLFGGQMTPFERQVALDYLNTDDSGVPSPYTDERVRETVGFMMGFKQFLEQ
ncbi:hypothetical protein ABI59_07005 [Acidobacteria bacterium Mor1]|nr:hypothetical protein ABI59_07005 [Acidobacteria bacterium Mor1]